MCLSLACPVSAVTRTSVWPYFDMCAMQFSHHMSIWRHSLSLSPCFILYPLSFCSFSLSPSLSAVSKSFVTGGWTTCSRSNVESSTRTSSNWPIGLRLLTNCLCVVSIYCSLLCARARWFSLLHALCVVLCPSCFERGNNHFLCVLCALLCVDSAKSVISIHCSTSHMLFDTDSCCHMFVMLAHCFCVCLRLGY